MPIWFTHDVICLLPFYSFASPSTKQATAVLPPATCRQLQKIWFTLVKARILIRTHAGTRGTMWKQ